jgi:dephospho-CoA kinase
MKSIGITGSIASGKSTVAKLMAGKKYPLFSADQVVTNLYKNKKFIQKLIKKFNLNKNENIKEQIKVKLKENKNNFKKLEKTIHPLVRKEMRSYLKKRNKLVIFEIPLLLESKLGKNFNTLVYVGAKKQVRLRRFLARKKKKFLFNLLSKRQMSPLLKQQKCDYAIHNNKSLALLKKNVKNFIKKYE